MHFNFLKKLNIKNRPTRIAVIISVVLLVCFITGISAKYINDNKGKLTQATALDFYFTIDVLGDTNELSQLEKNIHLFGGGEKSFSFNVQNYFDTLRINDKDISYQVSLECEDSSYTDKAYFQTKPDNFVIEASGGRQSDEFTVSFPTGYENTGKAVTVTAVVKATSPYVKEMKINFVLHSENAPLTYRVDYNKGDTYATLIVMANENISAGSLIVDWSAINDTKNVLQIDTTSPHVVDGTVSLDTNTPGDSFLNRITTTRNIIKGESIQIYFFKSAPAEDYTMPDTYVSADASGKYNVLITK